MKKKALSLSAVGLIFIPVVCIFCFGTALNEQADLEKMPSRSHYFDWINSQYEGTTEAQTLINMDFFQWLHDEYGMVLDVYALDVGNIDDGPYTAGVGRLIPYHYGTLQSEEFQAQFPNGLTPLVKKSSRFWRAIGGLDGAGWIRQNT